MARKRTPKADTDGHQPKRAGARKAQALARQREALRLVGEGMPVTEVAKRVGVHRQRVAEWAAESGIAEEQARHLAADEAARSEAAEEARAIVRQATPDAARYLHGVVSGDSSAEAPGEDPKTQANRIKAASEILSRGGVPIMTEKSVNGAMTVDADEAVRKLRALMDARDRGGDDP